MTGRHVRRLWLDVRNGALAGSAVGLVLGMTIARADFPAWGEVVWGFSLILTGRRAARSSSRRQQQRVLAIGHGQEDINVAHGTARPAPLRIRRRPEHLEHALDLARIRLGRGAHTVPDHDHPAITAELGHLAHDGALG
ncbi:MAG: hypothetical protein WD794_12560 [Mycobacteriales bacterium]